MTLYRLSEQKPCARIDECSWVEDGEECPEPAEHCDTDDPCAGCNGDGTRWVLTDRTVDLPDGADDPKKVQIIAIDLTIKDEPFEVVGVWRTTDGDTTDPPRQFAPVLRRSQVAAAREMLRDAEPVEVGPPTTTLPDPSSEEQT